MCPHMFTDESCRALCNLFLDLFAMPSWTLCSLLSFMEACLCTWTRGTVCSSSRRLQYVPAQFWLLFLPMRLPHWSSTRHATCAWNGSWQGMGMRGTECPTKDVCALQALSRAWKLFDTLVENCHTVLDGSVPQRTWTTTNRNWCCVFLVSFSEMFFEQGNEKQRVLRIRTARFGVGLCCLHEVKRCSLVQQTGPAFPLARNCSLVKFVNLQNFTLRLVSPNLLSDRHCPQRSQSICVRWCGLHSSPLISCRCFDSAGARCCLWGERTKLSWSCTFYGDLVEPVHTKFVLDFMGDCGVSKQKSFRAWTSRKQVCGKSSTSTSLLALSRASFGRTLFSRKYSPSWYCALPDVRLWLRLHPNGKVHVLGPTRPQCLFQTWWWSFKRSLSQNRSLREKFWQDVAFHHPNLSCFWCWVPSQFGWTNLFCLHVLDADTLVFLCVHIGRSDGPCRDSGPVIGGCGKEFWVPHARSPVMLRWLYFSSHARQILAALLWLTSLHVDAAFPHNFAN